MNHALEVQMQVLENESIDMQLGEVISGGGEGTKNYEHLINKPSINTHILVGDSNFEDIGLHFMTNVELQQLLGG